MSAVYYGEDYEYAKSRLNKSVVRLGKVPVYVQDVCMEKGIVTYTILSRNRWESNHLDEFDLSPVPLGYVNTPLGCTFVCRKPIRYYKQGLTTDNYVSYPLKVQLFHKGFLKAIMGNYPKPVEALEEVLCGENESVAFSRDFSFSSPVKQDIECNLLFRTVVVGKAIWNVAGNNINYHLDENYEFLQEMLEESINVQH